MKTETCPRYLDIKDVPTEKVLEVIGILEDLEEYDDITALLKSRLSQSLQAFRQPGESIIDIDQGFYHADGTVYTSEDWSYYRRARIRAIASLEPFGKVTDLGPGEIFMSLVREFRYVCPFWQYRLRRAFALDTSGILDEEDVFPLIKTLDEYYTLLKTKWRKDLYASASKKAYAYGCEISQVFDYHFRKLPDRLQPPANRHARNTMFEEAGVSRSPYRRIYQILVDRDYFSSSVDITFQAGVVPDAFLREMTSFLRYDRHSSASLNVVPLLYVRLDNRCFFSKGLFYLAMQHAYLSEIDRHENTRGFLEQTGWKEYLNKLNSYNEDWECLLVKDLFVRAISSKVVGHLLRLRESEAASLETESEAVFSMETDGSS